MTASFIKELLRRAFLQARAEDASVLRDVDAALDQLLDPTAPLTPSLLGVSEETLLQRAKARGARTAWCGI